MADYIRGLTLPDLLVWAAWLWLLKALLTGRFRKRKTRRRGRRW